MPIAGHSTSAESRALQLDFPINTWSDEADPAGGPLGLLATREQPRVKLHANASHVLERSGAGRVVGCR
uniref:Uncharacterized protein n=1 Tax=Tanacetum cinerariifolium TaxID=118510 RepID=A0A699TYB1_TANCI|nr:hypothetical protein [Tanacetum cinerariifolium]